MKKIKLEVRDVFDDVNENKYIEIRIGEHEACCVKKPHNGSPYILQCYDGNEVYSDIGGADWPLRTLKIIEAFEVLKFANAQFEGR